MNISVWIIQKICKGNKISWKKKKEKTKKIIVIFFVFLLMMLDVVMGEWYDVCPRNWCFVAASFYIYHSA